MAQGGPDPYAHVLAGLQATWTAFAGSENVSAHLIEEAQVNATSSSRIISTHKTTVG